LAPIYLLETKLSYYLFARAHTVACKSNVYSFR